MPRRVTTSAASKPPELPPQPERSVKYFTSGSTLLDLVLGGGYALGRVSNIVGDRSSGKTLLAIEAMANFAMAYDAKHIKYEEAENAFDEDYGRTLGIPDGIERGDLDEPIRTVQQFETSLVTFLEAQIKLKAPACLYTLDSLDALSDDAEMERKVGEGSYNMAKPKFLSEMFRKRIGLIAQANCHLLIISQMRDKIGVTFGETKTRSGGKALDFYASQIIWLAEIGKIKRTVTGVERIVGADVKVRNKKNKVGMPFRDAEFPVLFNYGVDDEDSMIDWLKTNKGFAADQSDKEVRLALQKARRAVDRDEVRAIGEMLRTLTRERWNEIEEALKPTLPKYERA